MVLIAITEPWGAPPPAHPALTCLPFSFPAGLILTSSLLSFPDRQVVDIEEETSTRGSYHTATIFAGVLVVMVVAVAAFALGRRVRAACAQPPSTKM